LPATLAFDFADFVVARLLRDFFVFGALVPAAGRLPDMFLLLLLRMESTSFCRVLSVFVMIALSPG
jgi:hypothetical protein